MSLVISLGWNCYPASHAVAIGIRKTKEQGYKTCPFDLCVTNYEGITKCIEEDFENFLKPEHLVIKTVKENEVYDTYKKGDLMIYNKYYKFIFNLESPGHANLYNQENWEGGTYHYIVDGFKKFKERYEARIQNFRQYLSENQSIHFLISSFRPGIEELKAVCQMRYPTHNFIFEQLVPPEKLHLLESLYNMMEIEPKYRYYPKTHGKYCFVIALKYYKNYPTTVFEYIENIRRYCTGAKILIVDNFSPDKIELPEGDDIEYILNTSGIGFELGAYKFAIRYLLESGQTQLYEYFIFTQDSFYLYQPIKIESDILACPIVSSKPGQFRSDFLNGIGYWKEHPRYSMIREAIEVMGLENEIDNLTFCFSNNFVLKGNTELFGLFLMVTETKLWITNTKIESESTERMMSGLLYLLNHKKNQQIEPTMIDEVFGEIYVGNEIKFKYFKKKINNKTENTC